MGNILQRMTSALAASKKGISTAFMGLLLIALVAIVLGLLLLPTVRAAVNESSQGASASESSLLNLIPLLWILGMVAVAVALVVIAFKTTKGG